LLISTRLTAPSSFFIPPPHHAAQSRINHPVLNYFLSPDFDHRSSASQRSCDFPSSFLLVLSFIPLRDASLLPGFSPSSTSLLTPPFLSPLLPPLVWCLYSSFLFPYFAFVCYVAQACSFSSLITEVIGLKTPDRPRLLSRSPPTRHTPPRISE